MKKSFKLTVITALAVSSFILHPSSLKAQTSATYSSNLLTAPIVCQHTITNLAAGLYNTNRIFAMVCPIDLLGASVTISTGTLDCEPLACVGGTHAQKRAWWAGKRGGEQDKLAITGDGAYRVRFGANPLGDATVVDDNGNPIDLANYPNRIVKGSYHAWMKLTGGTQVNAIRAQIKVSAQYAEYDAAGSTPAETDTNGNQTRKANTHDLHCHVTLTNAPAGVTTFTGANVNDLGESPVTGLAQNIFNSRSTLDYDGTHEIIDPGLPNGSPATAPLQQIVGHWNVLNISGGAAAWESAGMTISGTEIDLVTNHIQIEVGPSKHLQPQDWNSMLQFFRYRRLYLNSSVRATGYGGSGGTVDMPLNTPDANTVPGLAVDQQVVQIAYATPSDPTTPVTGQINSDAASVASILAATTPTPISGATATAIKTMQPREVKVCDDSGNPFYIIVMATGGYTKP